MTQIIEQGREGPEVIWGCRDPRLWQPGGAKEGPGLGWGPLGGGGEELGKSGVHRSGGGGRGGTWVHRWGVEGRWSRTGASQGPPPLPSPSPHRV